MKHKTRQSNLDKRERGETIIDGEGDLSKLSIKCTPDLRFVATLVGKLFKLRFLEHATFALLSANLVVPTCSRLWP